MRKLRFALPIAVFSVLAWLPGTQAYAIGNPASGANTPTSTGSGVSSVLFGTGAGEVQNITIGSAALPSLPSTSAPSSTWQNYVNSWNIAMNPSSVAASFTAEGCDVLNVSTTPMTAGGVAAINYPSGVAPDAVTVLINCNAVNHAILRIAHTSPGAGSECETVGGPGTQCVNGCTVDGDATVCSSYTYGGTSIYGHVEISTDGAGATTCSVGTLVTNSTPETLTNGDELLHWTAPPSGSNVWNGNFWQGSSSPYTNEGDACAAI